MVAYSFNTGRIWPHKLVSNDLMILGCILVFTVVAEQVHGLLSDLRSSFNDRFSLFTHAPIVCIQRIEAPLTNHRWRVQTARGNTTARTVILATNGYTRHLLESSCGESFSPPSHFRRLLAGAVMPKRYQMAAYTVPELLLANWRFNFTFGVRGLFSNTSTDNEDGYGMTTYDGTLVAGSELAQIASISEDEPHPWMNHTDDSRVLGPTTECKCFFVDLGF